MSDNNNLPLLPQQKRLLKYELNEESKGSQNAGIAFQLRGNIDFDRLDECLSQLVEFHDALKMNFSVKEDGSAVHKVNDFDIRWIKHDFTNIPEERKEKQALKSAEETVLAPIDVLNEPLFEFHLYKLAEDWGILLVKASHIIVDGPSFTAIYVQLSELYTGSENLVKPFSWKNFILQEMEYAKSPAGNKSAAYWQNQLIPVSVSIQDIKNLNYSTVHNESNRLSMSELKKVAKEEKTSVFNIVIFLYTYTLAEIFRCEEFAVTYTLTNRFKEEMRHMVGLTTHNLPHVLTDISSKNVSQLISETKKQMNNSFSHFIMGECAEIPYFSLSYLSETIKLPDWDGLNVTRHPFTSNQKYNDLTYTLICSEGKDFIELGVNTSREIYKPEFDDTLFSRMKKKLSKMAYE